MSEHDADRVDETLVDKWQTVLADEHERIRALASAYPDDRALYVPYAAIQEREAGLARRIRMGDADTRRAGRTALQRLAPEVAGDELDGNPEINTDHQRNLPLATVRIRDFPDRRTYRVGRQRAHHLGSIIAITGRVVDCETVDPMATRAVFECRKCGTDNSVPQSPGRMDYPIECRGCEERNKSIWIFNRSSSNIIDQRKVTLAPIDSNTDDPPLQTALLHRDLVDAAGPGDRVTVIGYYETYARQQTTDLRTYLDVWGVENRGGGEVDKLSPAELEERITDFIADHQDATDGGDFGVPRRDVLDELSSDGVREREIEDRLDDLEGRSRVHDVGGGLLMVN
jgi:replicative DNA helicase Mcm